MLSVVRGVYGGVGVNLSISWSWALDLSLVSTPSAEALGVG
jgi:hypothetical protein